MKYSMMTYTVMRQGGYTPADCVRIASDLGMEGIDWVSTYGEDPKLLRKMSVDAGLTVAAHTFFIKTCDVAEAREIASQRMDNAVLLGAPLVMIPPAPFAGVTDPDENRRRWAEVLAAVFPLAEERGLVLTVENFPGAASAVVTAADFYELKKAVPALKLTFDDGNAAGGEDPVASLKACLEDVVHVHFKDWVFSSAPGGKPMKNGLYASPALVGEGDVPTCAVEKVLADAGYAGFINIEYENNVYPAEEAVRRALAYLKNTDAA